MNEAILETFRAGLLSPDEVCGKRILEVGAYDVNGSVRSVVELMEPASYLGVDIVFGPRVDRIMDCRDLIETLGECSFDVVITTEMLEHVDDWRTCITNLAGVTTVGGLLVITTRSPGFPYHEYPADYWRYTPDVLSSILETAGLDVLLCFPDPDAGSPGVIAKARKSDRDPGDLEACLQPEPMEVPA